MVFTVCEVVLINCFTLLVKTKLEFFRDQIRIFRVRQNLSTNQDTVVWYTYCLKAKKSYMVVVVIEVVVVHSSSGKNT